MEAAEVEHPPEVEKAPENPERHKRKTFAGRLAPAGEAKQALFEAKRTAFCENFPAAWWQDAHERAWSKLAGQDAVNIILNPSTCTGKLPASVCRSATSAERPVGIGWFKVWLVAKIYNIMVCS